MRDSHHTPLHHEPSVGLGVIGVGAIVQISGVSTSLVELLRDTYRASHPASTLDFKLMGTSDIKANLDNKVGLFLYRVESERTRRYEDKGGQRFLRLDLRYLLMVWGKNEAKCQDVLQECIVILDSNAVLRPPQLSTSYTWADGDEVKVTMDSLSVEDMMRIWDSLDVPYHLSIPYLARTVLAPSYTQQQAPLVSSRVVDIGRMP